MMMSDFAQALTLLLYAALAYVIGKLMHMHFKRGPEDDE